jgi:AcrR family transcriptional regulator
MARDAQATRSRILRAAVDEFAAHGLAGARIDRIAAAAQANKRSIYDYYGNKDALFGASLDLVLGQIAVAVPLTPDDFPGYAGRIFDHLHDRPAAWRLGMWLQLERPGSRPDEINAANLEALGDARQGAVTGGFSVADVLVLVVGLTHGWFLSPPTLLATGGADPASEERRVAHRAVLVEAVRRICAPGAAPTG